MDGNRLRCHCTLKIYWVPDNKIKNSYGNYHRSKRLQFYISWTACISLKTCPLSDLLATSKRCLNCQLFRCLGCKFQQFKFQGIRFVLLSYGLKVNLTFADVIIKLSLLIQLRVESGGRLLFLFTADGWANANLFPHCGHLSLSLLLP